MTWLTTKALQGVLLGLVLAGFVVFGPLVLWEMSHPSDERRYS